MQVMITLKTKCLRPVLVLYKETFIALDRTGTRNNNTENNIGIVLSLDVFPLKI